MKKQKSNERRFGGFVIRVKMQTGLPLLDEKRSAPRLFGTIVN
jgi:hypothetical protein